MSRPAAILLLGYLLKIAPGASSAPANNPQDISASVPVWGRFEFDVTNTTVYRDPLRNVSLDVSFSRPDGSKVVFQGFHDGGQKWKVRFMPDRTGRWTYEARFSDEVPGACGAFTCTPSHLPMPIGCMNRTRCGLATAAEKRRC